MDDIEETWADGRTPRIFAIGVALGGVLGLALGSLIGLRIALRGAGLVRSALGSLFRRGERVRFELLAQ